MIRSLVSLLVPPVCHGCGAPAAVAMPLCAPCRADLWWTEDGCPACGLPRPCRPCPAAGQDFDAAWSAVVYDGPARALVAALKFGGRLAVADAMAAQMAATAPSALLVGTVVPVAADPRRRRVRGFDHADLLAAALARRAGLPRMRCLRQRGRRAPQRGAGRAERLRRGGSGVMACAPVPPQVVLVDDVHTTGATLDAASSALRAAGASRIVALTYARTLR